MPYAASVELPTVTCLKCGHTWVPRKNEIHSCPKCGSVRWDEPRG